MLKDDLAALEAEVKEHKQAETVLEELSWRAGVEKRIEALKESNYEDYSAIKQKLANLVYTLRKLPDMPEKGEMGWARGVLAFPGAGVMEVDTTGLEEDADIVRLVLMNMDGLVEFDALITSPHFISAQEHWTGITKAAVDSAPDLAQVWDDFRKAIEGKLIISYNQEWDRGMIEGAADRAGLEEAVIIGDCLMLHLEKYLRQGYRPKMEVFLGQIGRPLPSRPDQNAVDRCKGQIEILKAMSEGIMRRQSPATPVEEAEDDQGEIDLIPF